MKKPILGHVPEKVPSPKVNPSTPPKKLWRFSFKYWRQVKHFGLNDLDPKWFAALFEKLSELSGTYLEDIVTSPAVKRVWRYHDIDWSRKSVPMIRKDFDWVDEDYLGNEAEFPFVQFQITKGFGRVVGFWDDDNTFNILLLDPMHNIQPSKYTDYKLREARIAETHFAATIRDFESKIQHCGEDCQCRSLYGDVQRILTQSLPFSAILIAMENDTFDKCVEHITSGLAESVEAILALGLDSLSS